MRSTSVTRGRKLSELVSSSSPLEFKPKKYQRRSIEFMVTRPAAGVFLDPGLGKTVITYMAFDILRSRKIVKRALVVSKLLPMLETWPHEITKWGLDISCKILHGGKKDRLLNDIIAGDDTDVCLINYEGLPWLFKKLTESGKKNLFDMVVFDESSKLRNHTARTLFKLVKQHLNWFKRRYILTGTPAPKGLMNLWSQIFVLDGGTALGKFITHFREKYFDRIDVNYGFSFWEIKRGAEEKIYKAITPLVVRFGDEELDLPPLTFNDVIIKLPPKVQQVHDDMKRDLISAIEGGIITAKNAGVATQKLRQICNGGLYVEDSSTYERIAKHLHYEKAEAVKSLVDELGGKPVLVSYEFHHDLERLKQTLGKDTPHIGGGVPKKRISEIMRAWNAGEIPVLLGQPQTVAHGVNLQYAGQAVIFHSLVWDYEAYDQFIRRIWRQGQTKHVVVHRIIADSPVDRAIIESMNVKGKTQNDLFSALRRHMRGKKL